MYRKCMRWLHRLRPCAQKQPFWCTSDSKHHVAFSASSLMHPSHSRGALSTTFSLAMCTERPELAIILHDIGLRHGLTLSVEQCLPKKTPGRVVSSEYECMAATQIARDPGRQCTKHQGRLTIILSSIEQLWSNLPDNTSHNTRSTIGQNITSSAPVELMERNTILETGTYCSSMEFAVRLDKASSKVATNLQLLLTNSSTTEGNPLDEPH